MSECTRKGQKERVKQDVKNPSRERQGKRKGKIRQEKKIGLNERKDKQGKAMTRWATWRTRHGAR